MHFINTKHYIDEYLKDTEIIWHYRWRRVFWARTCTVRWRRWTRCRQWWPLSFPRSARRSCCVWWGNRLGWMSWISFIILGLIDVWYLINNLLLINQWHIRCFNLNSFFYKNINWKNITHNDQLIGRLIDWKTYELLNLLFLGMHLITSCPVHSLSSTQSGPSQYLKLFWERKYSTCSHHLSPIGLLSYSGTSIHLI